MADECGLQFQLNYFQSLATDMAIHPACHVTADVSYEDMKTEYDRLMREDPAFAAEMAAWQAKAKQATGGDELTPLVAAMAGATPGQKRLARARGPYSASNPLWSGKTCSPTAMAVMKELVSLTMATKAAPVLVLYATTDSQPMSWPVCQTQPWPQS
jgi:anti-sigma factor RsiW